MYRLFIEITKDDIRELELPNNFSISFNYSQTDYSNPQVVKVGYSTSVNIEGTPNNNNVFNNIYEVSSFYEYTAEGETIKNVNPNLRLNYKLYYNSTEVSAGYIKINKITNNYNKIVYNITLYDEIGSYLYNAMYNSDGSLKTLADLNYGLTNEDETLTYDHHYMLQSWSTLMGDTKVKGPNNEQYDLNGKLPAELKNSLQSLIVPIPCYSGLYDNFDNNKILVSATDENGNVTMLDPYTYDKLTKSYMYRQTPLKNELRNYTDKDKTYDVYNGWELFETERDLMNFEIPELIANRTPLGVNLGKVFRTICASSNISIDDVEDYIKTLDKTYFMLKDIPQTYGNISESDKQFYPSELVYRSDYMGQLNPTTKNLAFKGFNTSVESKNNIEGGQNAHITLKPRFNFMYSTAAFNGYNKDLTVYNPYFYTYTSNVGNTWILSDRNQLLIDANLTVSVIYYIVTMKDNTTNKIKRKIYPLCGTNHKNYNTNSLKDEDLKALVQQMIIYRTKYTIFGDFRSGELPEGTEIDWRYLWSTWSRNTAASLGKTEFFRNDMDIYMEGFDNDYELKIESMPITILVPLNRSLYGLKHPNDEWSDENFGLRYYDYINFCKGTIQYSSDFYWERNPSLGTNYILWTQKPNRYNQNQPGYIQTKIDITNDDGTGVMDLIESHDTYSVNGITFRTGFEKMMLNGIYMQFETGGSWFAAGDLYTDFKVSTYVGSEDISIATISKDILKQVNSKEIFLNVLKMLNLTILIYIDQKNEVQIYDNGEYITSITIPTWQKTRDQYPKDITFKFVFNNYALLNNKFEWYVPYDEFGQASSIEIINLNNKIDRTSIEIIPTVIESNEYDYNIKPIESYAENIRQYYNEEYQKHKNIYKYEHNTSIIDSLKDVTFKTALDYKLKSVWFNDNMISGDNYHQYLAFNKGAHFTQTLFNTSGEELSSVQVQNSGALYALKNLEISQYVEDTSSRLCMFNKDNSMSDFEKCLVCYTGFEERKTPITITDDIPAAQQINNNFCYVLYPRRGNTTNRGKVVWDVNLGLLKDANDVYFELLNVPLFSNNVDNTVLGYTNLDKSNGDIKYTNLYDLYFKDYNNVFFNESLKKITCNVRFNETLKYKILGSIYYFDNSYWVVNKLINFNLEKEFNKAELIQIDYNMLSRIIGVEEHDAD